MTRSVTIKPSVAVLTTLALIIAALPWFEGGREPVAGVLSAGMLLLASLLLWRQPEAPQLGLKGVGLPAWLLLGWAVLSLLWSVNRFETWIWILSFGLAVVAFRLAYILGEEALWRGRLVSGYILSAFIFALYGFWLFFTGDYPRLTSSLYWANPAAAYLLPAALLATARLVRPGGRAVLVPVSVLLWAAFWLADSRGAMLALVLAGLVAALLARPRRRVWTTFILAVGFGYVLSFAAVQYWTMGLGRTGAVAPGSRFAEAAQGESTSGSDRLRYLVSAGEMAAARPLLGFGAGTYGTVHPMYQGRVVSASDNAHNAYAQAGAELGLPGAILSLWLALALLKGLLRRVRATPAAFPAAAGALALLLLFGLDIGASYPALLVLAAILGGIAYCPPRIPEPARLAGAFPLLAAGLVAVAALINTGTLAAERGRALQDEEKFVEAAEEFGRAADGPMADPDWRGAQAINRFQLARGKGPQGEEGLERALELARRARAADPYDAQHHQLLGRIQASRKKYAQAEREFREALRLDPYNRPEYALDLTRTLVAAGRPEAAAEAAREMLRRYPPDVIENRMPDRQAIRSIVFLRLELAQILAAQGKTEEAARLQAAAQELYKRLP